MDTQAAGMPALGAVSNSRYGLIRVLNNKQIDDEKKQEEQLEAERQKQVSEPEKTGLRKIVWTAWERNKRYREQSGVDADMLRCLRQRNNEYEPDKLAEIQDFGGTEVFMGVTALKCDAAEAWAHDILGSEYDPPWELKPSPIPDLPQDVLMNIVEETLIKVQQNAEAGGAPMTPDQIAEMARAGREEVEDAIQEEAEERAAAMERKIRDQQQEGNWETAFADFVTNLVTLPAGFIKGPIVRQREKLVYDYVNGKTIVERRNVICLDFESPSPLDCYPSPGSITPQQGEFLERQRLTRSDLMGVMGLPGYDDMAINLVLKEYGASGYRNWTAYDNERLSVEQKGDDLDALKDYMEALEYWGKVQGLTLLQEGITLDAEKKPIKPLMDYDTNCIMIGNYIIYKAVNLSKIGRRPYSHCGWSVIPGSFWYKPVPMKMKDLQDIINATMRALVNNEAVASGPQAIYNDVNRVAPGDNISSIFPWRVHLFTNPGNSQLRPLEFYQPATNANELLTVYRDLSNMADEYTGIPAYEQGNDNMKGAGQTMGGLSMLMTSAARGMKRVIMRVDKFVLEPTLKRHIDFLMEFDPDESIKGDVQVLPKGVMAKIAQEQMEARKNEFFQLTNNPTDLAIIGLDGRAEMLEDRAKALEIKLRIKNKKRLAAAMPADPAAEAGAEAAPAVM